MNDVLLINRRCEPSIWRGAYSSLELDKSRAASAPDPTPTSGLYFPIDHFSFAKLGSPALYIGTGMRSFEKREEYGKQAEDELCPKVLPNKPSDE